MGGPEAYCGEWSKSERETPIQYVNIYICNLARWYWQSYMQGSKGETDVNNRLSDSVGKGEGRMIWENNIDTYTLPHVNRWPVWIWFVKQGTQS